MIHLEILRLIRRALQCADPTCKCHYQLGEEENYECYPTHCPIDRDHENNGPSLWLMVDWNYLGIACFGRCESRIKIEVSSRADLKLLWYMQDIEQAAKMKEPLPKGLGKGREV
jgi:hypothetical protein